MPLSNITTHPGQNPAPGAGQKPLSTLPGQPRTTDSPGKAPESLAEQREKALSLVEQTLAKGYEDLGLQRPDGAFRAIGPLTAEKAAGNILGFIEQRLQKDAAEGATQEELQARLEAGLAGFERGFAEAKEKLDALSMLTPEVRSDIGQTRDLVLAGIEDLRTRLTDGLSVPGESEQVGAVTGRYGYASASQFSFEVETASGDTVTIDASRSQGTAGTVGEDSSSLATSANGDFQFAVQGSLSGEEREAIGNLLERVDRLAGQFFSGDLDGAFDSALNMGFDDAQIASFSLNLTQVEVQKVSAAYQGVGNQAPSELAQGLKPVGEFAGELQQAREEAGQFAEPEQLLGNVAEQMSGPEGDGAERFSDFIQRLLSATE